VIRRMAREAIEEDDRGETLALAYLRASNEQSFLWRSVFLKDRLFLHRQKAAGRPALRRTA